MSQNSATVAATPGPLDGSAAAVSYFVEAAHFSADLTHSFGQYVYQTPAQICCTPVNICCPLVPVSVSSSLFQQDATKPFLTPVPDAARGMMNIKASNALTRDAKGLSFHAGSWTSCWARMRDHLRYAAPYDVRSWRVYVARPRSDQNW